MLGELVPCGGGDSIPLYKQKMLIGRQDFCDITLRYKNVSSRHCELESRDGYWYIRDLNSTNGIRVNGKACESKALVPGDEIWVGRHRFTIHYELEAGALPPDDGGPRPELSQGLLAKAGIDTDASNAEKRPMRTPKGTLGELVPRGGGDSLPLISTRLTIGRHPKCDIVLKFSTVSARHCELELIDGYWKVRDLGSSNGTRINGKRIEEGWLLPGSVLWVDRYRFEAVYAAMSNKAPPDDAEVSMVRGLLDKAGLVRRKDAK